MIAPSMRTAKLAAALATPLAVIAAGGIVWQGSHAAFTGQTRNSGNDWSTGSVALTDDDKGAARFQVANMTPGQTDTKCITVTANASVAGTVKGYAVNPSFSSTALADHIFVTLREGTGGSFDSCTGFSAQGTIASDVPLSSFASINSYANALGGWNVQEGTSSRTYELTWKFNTTGMTQTQIDDLQGKRAGIDMQWELQSS
ncbi:MAG TPA: hypothetical protein VNS81_10805 [Nocardioides sp.]|nr:hypothetical protein [Nocardioides sp.]